MIHDDEIAVAHVEPYVIRKIAAGPLIRPVTFRISRVINDPDLSSGAV